MMMRDSMDSTNNGKRRAPHLSETHQNDGKCREQLHYLTVFPIFLRFSLSHSYFLLYHIHAPKLAQNEIRAKTKNSFSDFPYRTFPPIFFAHTHTPLVRSLLMSTGIFLKLTSIFIKKKQN